MLMSPMRDGTTSEDSATQLLICEPLSFAIMIWGGVQKMYNNVKCIIMIEEGLHFLPFCLKQWKSTIFEVRV